MNCMDKKPEFLNTINDLLDEYTQSGEADFSELSDGESGSIGILKKITRYFDYIPMPKRPILNSAIEWFIENQIEEFDFYLNDAFTFVEERSRVYEMLKTRLQTGWTVKPTGNMTLAILDGKRIVARVDMLSQNTLKAGDNGERLCRAINDLSAIANAVNGKRINLPHESGISPLPWSIRKSENRYTICDITGRTICSRNIVTTEHKQIVADFDVIEAVIQSICDIEEDIVLTSISDKEGV